MILFFLLRNVMYVLQNVTFYHHRLYVPAAAL
jgi:hypothetical protein